MTGGFRRQLAVAALGVLVTAACGSSETAQSVGVQATTSTVQALGAIVVHVAVDCEANELRGEGEGEGREACAASGSGAGRTVEVKDAAGATVMTVTADPASKFRVDLPSGRYRLRETVTGVVQDVIVSAGIVSVVTLEVPPPRFEEPK